MVQVREVLISQLSIPEEKKGEKETSNTKKWEGTDKP